MDRPIRYHQAFPADVRSAAAWYEERSPGLGEAFVEKVADATDRDNPDLDAPSEFGLRCYRAKRFPYVVLFDFRSNQLLILGVFHTAMSRQRWLDRMRDSGT
jgi:hypothetical protein